MFEMFLLRPDAVKALDNPMVKKILPRYVKMVNDQAIANFQLAKRIEFKQTKKSDLWKIHSKLMKKFYEMRDKVDKGKLKLKNLKKPSLLDLKIKLTEEIMKSNSCIWVRSFISSHHIRFFSWVVLYTVNSVRTGRSVNGLNPDMKYHQKSSP